MKAGRELDALVAEKVMGHSVLVLEGHPFIYHPEGYQQAVPKYSTDVADAWEMVDKLSKDGYFMHIYGHDARWSVGYISPSLSRRWNKEKVEIEGLCKSESAPLSICLAALKAVGVEV